MQCWHQGQDRLGPPSHARLLGHSMVLHSGHWELWEEKALPNTLISEDAFLTASPPISVYLNYTT